MENMVIFCLAVITPALEETVQQCIKDFHDKPNQDANSWQIHKYLYLKNKPPHHKAIRVAHQHLSLFLSPQEQMIIFKGVSMRGNKFASMLPPENESTDNRYRSLEKEGQSIFVKHSQTNSIPNNTKQMEAFNIFVAVYSEKFPHEIGSLMTCA